MKILERKNLHQAFEWNEDILCPKINYEITCPKCASVLHFQRSDFKPKCLGLRDGINLVNPNNPKEIISTNDPKNYYPKYPDRLGRKVYEFEITLSCPVCNHVCITRYTDYYLFEEQFQNMTEIDMLNFFKTIFDNDIEHYRKFSKKELAAIRKKQLKEERKRRKQKYYDDDDYD